MLLLLFRIRSHSVSYKCQKNFQNFDMKILSALPVPFTALPSGWCVLYDVLCKMPLSVFLALVQIPHEIQIVKDYLGHPQRRHFPLIALPTHLACYFLGNRTFSQRLSRMVESLSSVGLATCLGVTTQTLRRRMVFYLHRRASLLDTREAPPCELVVDTSRVYPVMLFEFSYEEEVCRYWHFAITICLNTRLSKLFSLSFDVL